MTQKHHPAPDKSGTEFSKQSAPDHKPVAKVYMGKREVSCHGPSRRYVDGVCVQLLTEDIAPDTLLYAAPPDVAELLLVLKGMDSIISDSKGVAGYHLNGDVAEWDEFEEVDALRATLAKHGGAA